MNGQRYYLSGRMRGIPEHNYPMFAEVEKALLKNCPEDSAVFNPANLFDGDLTRKPEEYMRADIAALVEADIVVLLPGWESSEGARREVQVARWTGKSFMVAEHTWTGIGLILNGRPTEELTAEWTFRKLDGPPDSLEPSARASVLDEARELITGDRNSQYGPPTQDFDRTAAMATAFGFTVGGEPLKGHHVAIFMMLLKTSRLRWAPQKRDSWVDGAGYAGCGWECAVNERNL